MGVLPSPSYRLYKFGDLPEWMRHNPSIMTGYRVCISFQQCLQSLFHLHNETWNIWTHLSAALGCIYLLWRIWHSPIFELGSEIEKILFAFYILSAQILFFCSSSFHLLGCMSEEWYSTFAKVDYAGISILIAGSYIVPIYYTFSCSPVAMAIYYLCVLAVGLSAIYTSFDPRFERPGYEKWRAGVFLVMGFLGLAMVPHMVYLYGWEAVWPGVWRALCVGAVYVCGVLIYLTQFPESLFPGAFDLAVRVWTIIVAGTIAHLYVCEFLQVHYTNVISKLCV